MKDDFEKNKDKASDPELHTREYILRMIAQYAREAKQRDIYISSCHSAVGYWIAREQTLLESDEIVLLGREDIDDHILHSIIVRNGEIVGDTEAQERGIQTRYDEKTGIYTTMHSKRSEQEVMYSTQQKMNVRDFKRQYLSKPDIEPDISDTL